MTKQSLKRTGVRAALMRSKVIKEQKKAEPKTTTVEKKIGGAKNGSVRKVTRSEPEAKTQKLKNACKIRSTITPGTVLVCLAGKYRGRRVVFLKSFESGLLLVTGPYKYNGVPLFRVNQRYVIATSTKVDISDITLPEIKESLFQKDKKSKKEFLSSMEVDKKVDASRTQLQKQVDSQVIPAIKKTPLLAAYLKSLFTLKKGQPPHALKF